jgi:hypothetical protein
VFKNLTIASVMLVQGVVEPLTSDPDITKYAITQGGLLFVVLVLIWSIRKDQKQKEDQQEERLMVMAKLVSDSTAAQIRAAETTERLARAVEAFSERRRNERPES